MDGTLSFGRNFYLAWSQEFSIGSSECDQRLFATANSQWITLVDDRKITDPQLIGCAAGRVAAIVNLKPVVTFLRKLITEPAIGTDRSVVGLDQRLSSSIQQTKHRVHRRAKLLRVDFDGNSLSSSRVNSIEIADRRIANTFDR